MRFCFFSPYENLKGGNTTLIITLITGLARAEKEVVLVNYKKGLIARELALRDVKIPIIETAEFKKETAPQLFHPTDLFVITFFNEEFNKLLTVNPRLIYYDINDFIARISDYKYGVSLRVLSKRLVTKLLRKHALLFMDDTGVGNLRREFNMIIDNPPFLPVPIEINKQANRYLSRLRDFSDGINITYIGRSVKWKLMVLKKLLDDLENNPYRVRVHILVDDLNQFAKILPVGDYPKIKMELIFYENFSPSEVEEFLATKSDVHFGMGTTALHSGQLGIPTILLDYSDQEFPPDYEYRWLFDSKNFSLGKNLKKESPEKGNSLVTVLESILSSDDRKSLSEQTFNYVVSHHASEKVIDLLLKFSARATFKFSDARWLIPYFFVIHRMLKRVYALISTGKKRESNSWIK